MISRNTAFAWLRHIQFDGTAAASVVTRPSLSGKDTHMRYTKQRIVKFKGMPDERVMFIVLRDGVGIARFDTESEADAFIRENAASADTSSSE